MEIPYFEIAFNKDAQLVDPQQLQVMKKAIADQQVTDLIVLSHGWNNDMAEARTLYAGLLKHIGNALSAELRSRDRRFISLNVLWPSKKFADKDLIAGGAAFISDDPERLTLIEEWKKMEPLLNDGDTLATYKSILDDLSRNADKERLTFHFTKLMKQLSPTGDDAENKLLKEISEADVKSLLEDGKLNYLEPAVNQGGAAGLSNAAFPTVSDPTASDPTAADAMDMQNGEAGGGVGTAGAAEAGGEVNAAEAGATAGAVINAGGAPGAAAEGGAASLSGILEGIRNLMNLSTYYKMKDRAGKVGKTALHPLLKDILAIEGNQNIRLHLIGHSFGARLVTSAVFGNDDASLKVQSLSLLQAAFSHYSFAKNYQPNADGAFRNVIVNHLVKGAFLITHTRADKAVGIAYAIASRIAGQVASALGDKDSLYGGLGGNGAQITPEVKQMILHNGSNPYGLAGGQVYNFLADGIIADHSDIVKPAVASAVVEAFFAQ